MTLNAISIGQGGEKQRKSWAGLIPLRTITAGQ